MAAKKIKTTKLDIIKCASEFFLEQGYSATSPKAISDALDIYVGNITYYFPTKEHLLAVFVKMLCAFQWKMMEYEANDGLSSVMAICLEFATMAAMCEEDEIVKDFYTSSYSSPLCLDIIRKNDTRRAHEVFGNYCPDWTDEHFEQAEIMVSGIEYSTLVTNGISVSLETRISGALDNILSIYRVPEELRKSKIDRVLSMDYRKISRRMIDDFKNHVKETNEQAFIELLKGKVNNQ